MCAVIELVNLVISGICALDLNVHKARFSYYTNDSLGSGSTLSAPHSHFFPGNFL